MDMTTCGELAEILAAQPKDRKVVLAKDAEGNGYSPLVAAREMTYLADSPYSGEIVNPDAGYEGAERVVVLEPTN